MSRNVIDLPKIGISKINNFDNFKKVIKDINLDRKLESDCYFMKRLKKSKKLYYEGVANTFLIYDIEKKLPIGYYMLCATSLVLFSEHVERVNLIPAIEIDTFYIFREYRGMILKEYKEDNETLSSILLDKCISDIIELTKNCVAAKYIKVISVPEAINFYEKAGFKHIDSIDSYNDLAIVKPSHYANVELKKCELMLYEL